MLIVCNDVIGAKMAGPAIRCVEIARQLASEHAVVLAAPNVSLQVATPFEIIEFSSQRFRQAADEADIVVVQGDALRAHPFLKDSSAVLVADLYCPIPLEYHQVSDGVDMETRTLTGAYLADVVREQLAYADHFICASERQRNYWLGALTAMGRINALRWPNASRANVDDLISLVPFGLSPVKPRRERNALREMFNIPVDDFVLVWGGGIYQWFDPLTVIRAVKQLVERGYRVHLAFVGVKHPNPGISQHDMCAAAVALSNELGLTGKFVHFNFGWVAYEDRHNYLLDADVGVSAHYNNPETIFSFRTRMLDYLWCGLPVVSTRGDVFGDSLAAEGCGIAIDYECVDGWVSAIKALIDDRGSLSAMSDSVFAYAEAFRWDRVVADFCARCGSLTKAADRDLVRQSLMPSAGLSILRRIKRSYSQGGFSALVRAVVRKVRRYA